MDLIRLEQVICVEVTEVKVSVSNHRLVSPEAILAQQWPPRSLGFKTGAVCHELRVCLRLLQKQPNHWWLIRVNPHSPFTVSIYVHFWGLPQRDDDYENEPQMELGDSQSREKLWYPATILKQRKHLWGIWMCMCITAFGGRTIVPLYIRLIIAVCFGPLFHFYIISTLFI